MTDDEDEEDDEPAVELGDGPVVEGAPIARIASRLTWPQERSRIDAKEGDAVIRTPDGPRHLGAVLEELDTTYFDRRQTFVHAVKDAVGRGPVATRQDESERDEPGPEETTGDSAGSDGTEQTTEG